jgi:TPR repeat protein
VSRLSIGLLRTVSPLCDNASQRVDDDAGNGYLWYRRAAEAGHVEAQYNLASMLAEGEGCERDLPAARKWLSRAVAGGYEYAQELVTYLNSLK